MTEEERLLNQAAKDYASKYWSDSEGSKIIAKLGFLSGAVYAFKAAKHRVIVSEARGIESPLQDVMDFIRLSLGEKE